MCKIWADHDRVNVEENFLAPVPENTRFVVILFNKPGSLNFKT